MSSTAPTSTAPAPTGPADGEPSSSVSIRPVVLPSARRGTDLQLRVSAPTTGDGLPVVVFSHGFGLSMDAYGPLADFWAAHGFVVVQPTHLDSASLGLAPDDPRGPRVWRYRIEDVVQVVDELDSVLAAVPGLAHRVDASRLAVAGHSYGATTVSALLGARVLAPAGDPEEDFTDSRASAGVLLCLAGLAGDDMTPLGRRFAFMDPDFDHLTTSSLIAAGDADQSMLSTRGPDWWTDAYRTVPAPTNLLTLFGAEHGLGGIDAYGGMAQPPVVDPATVSLVQEATTAYLRTALAVDPASWAGLREALERRPDAAGRIESR